MSENINIVDALHKTIYNQDQRIAELEEQLKNAIVPKFKYNQIVYVLAGRLGKKEKVIEMTVKGYIPLNSGIFLICEKLGIENTYLEKDVFATKEEAQAKLQELQGE